MWQLLLTFVDMCVEDVELRRLSTYMIVVAGDIFWSILGIKWELLDLENDLKRLTSWWHPPAPFCTSYE